MRIKLCYACAEKANDQCGQTRMVVRYDTHAKRVNQWDEQRHC